MVETPFIKLAKYALGMHDKSAYLPETEREMRLLWVMVGAKEHALLAQLAEAAVKSVEDQAALRRFGYMPACDGRYHGRYN